MYCLHKYLLKNHGALYTCENIGIEVKYKYYTGTFHLAMLMVSQTIVTNSRMKSEEQTGKMWKEVVKT
jgi:hypothetical protein